MPRKRGNTTLEFRFNGRRYTVTAPTRDEALMRKALKLDALEKGEITINRNTLVNVWISKWLKTYKEGQVNQSWYRDIKRMCDTYIIPAVGSMPINVVKPLHLQNVINSNQKSMSFNNKLFDIISQIFRMAYENDIIPKDITKSLKKVACGLSEHRRRALTQSERATLLSVINGGHRGRLFCLLMLYAGLRNGECAALKWADVNFDRNLIHVNKALKADGTIQPFTKTNAGMRTVPLQRVLKNALWESRGESTQYVCTNLLGNRYTKKTIHDMWENIKRLMDIELGATLYRNKIIESRIPPDLKLYNLRHTFCTDLQSAGVPINVARELMGHSDISVTAKIYTHHSHVAYDDALSRLNDFHEKNF